MKKRLSLYIRSLISLLRIVIMKIFNPRGLQASFIQDFSLSTRFLVSDSGKLCLKKHIHTKKNVSLEAQGGILEIGEGCFFNNGCMAVSKERISIGNYVSCGPNVMIYDHDHDIHSGKDVHDSGYRTSSVVIGDNVWIGANSVILRGSVLGNGCIVGAGSIIKGTYPPETVIVQKRIDEISRRRERV